MSNDFPAIELTCLGLLRDGRWILRDITWRVPAGACAAILGPNGSGKSTLTRIIAAHLFPTAGECRILGGHFGDINLLELRQGIRLVQPAGPYDIDPELTAREVILTGFFASLALYETPTRAMKREATRVLAQVGLSQVADHPYRTLSSGERIRSLIGRALVHKPRLLLLDEPTAGLDLLAREQVLATVQGLFDDNGDRPTVVMVTHHIEELPPATSHVILLSDGRSAAQGTPRQVIQPKVLSRAYGCPVRVRRSNGRHYLEVHPEAWGELLGVKRGK